MTIIEVFTDGSYMRNDNIAGYGIYFPNGEIPNVSKPFIHKPITSQRAELYAIYKAILIITNVLTVDKIIIYSDSEYSIKSLTIWIKKWKTNNWKSSTGEPVKNVDIIKKIDNCINDFDGVVKFIHINSHTGKTDRLSLANHEADILARNGAFKTKRNNVK